MNLQKKKTPRRLFIKNLLLGLTVLRYNNLFARPAFKGGNSYLIDNPYEGVNWNQFKQITSTSHMHLTTKEWVERAYHECKFRHIAISNYYPSAPYYPIDSIRENQFMVKQNFGTMFKPNKDAKAEFVYGPIDWNKVIMEDKDWYGSLTAEQKSKMPFKAGKFMFKNLPKDLLISPNAEQHSFTNVNLHANSLGSLYSSGAYYNKELFQSREHGYALGTGLPWQLAFKKILDQLLFPDAGGITINHPVWSKLKLEQVCEMLDFDARVLGIEVFNDSCYAGFGDPLRGWSLKMWDEILRSGRKCFGFFVPDHFIGRGRNMLIVKDFTEKDCLTAYRKGAFYGAIYGSGLAFSDISLNHDRVLAKTNKISTIRFVTNKGEALKVRETSGAEYQIPKKGLGNPDITYVRIEAFDDTGEQIYSQPIRFTFEHKN